MARERLKRTVLLEETIPFSATIETLDLHELRAAFSSLFDQTAQQVFLRGLDLDDVIVERLMICRRSDGATVRVPVPALSDREAVVRSLQQAGGVGESSGPAAAPAEACAIVAQVILEQSDA